jgi:holo-[acyl-carrier protein] synthase
MILGVGIDVIEISRIDDMEKRWGTRFSERVFTPEEIAYCSDRSNRAASFAARFAAKEAFTKALGTGWDGSFRWKDFSIHTLPGGRPVAVLSPSMRARLPETTIHLSLSHSDHYAVAVVVFENIERHDE